LNEEHTDTYFGTKVSDPYNWLEEMQSDRVIEWIKTENKITENYLSRIPFRKKMMEAVTDVLNYERYSAPFKSGKYYFFFKNEGLQNQSILYRQEGQDGNPEVFLDPNTLSDDGTVSIENTKVSWDDKYLAYTINRAGSDWEEIYIIDIETKEQLSDRLDWAKFSGIDWLDDGFYYNRYDEVLTDKLKEINLSPKIYFHKTGTRQSEDKLIYEDKDQPDRSFINFTTEDRQYLFMMSWKKGSIGNTIHYQELSKSESGFTPITEEYDHQCGVIETEDNAIYIRTNKNAPKEKIIKFTPSTGDSIDLIPESEFVINDVNFIDGKFFVQYLKDACDVVYVFDTNGNFLNEIDLPAKGSVTGFSGRKSSKELFYIFTSFTYPPEIFKYEIENRSSSVFRESNFKIDPEKYETHQLFYPSKDGTLIPMFVVHKKGIELNGSNPLLLQGYGGFNISQTPEFSPIKLILLDNGGVFALACLRGGGEYGKEWHRAGMKLNKQNVFDDFICAAEYLIREKYTSSEKLAIRGGSNGGLLIGAVLNQRPELFKVGLPDVGVMDMLKFHKYTIGWSWVSDYGSIDDEIHFRNLYLYSPLHNIKAQDYPAVLISTSDHDDRVVPLHSYKYAATLQEKNTSENPILIRVDTDAGHGAGKPISKAIEEQTDVMSFVFYNLGITAF